MKLIHPKYKFFSQRLVIMNLNEVKLDRFLNVEHQQKLHSHISKHGLICPLVVDAKKSVISGQHRIRALKNLGLGSATFFYKTANKFEQIFFTELNKKIFQQWKTNTVDENLQFLFSPEFSRYTSEVRHLFTEPVQK